MTLKDGIQSILDEYNIDAGVAIWHIESGEKSDVNGDVPFPMASTFKIPIIATAARQIKSGQLNLDTRITLKDEDKSPGSGILPFFEAGVNPTVRDLLTLMIIISDNTATDMTVDLLGGASVIESYMHELGLTDIFFKMNCKDLIRELFPPDVQEMSPEEIAIWSETNDILRDGLCFSRESDNNVSSANHMNELLRMIFESEIVEGELREEVLNIMFKQQFNVRVSRFFPPNTKFAHKTGTIGGIRNDSGILFLNDENHVIITLFTEWDEAAVRFDSVANYQRIFEVETAMGKIGRLAYDHYST
mgnify:CR=1 FL=1